MWYSNLYRRHLLDMHIEDWDPDFLSRFSPEAYVENLKKADINYAMIYFQSHVGLCYFPTASGDMHKALLKQPDMIRRTVQLCRESGIRVCAYYSLIHNTREHDKHPQWRMRNASGVSLREYGALHPENPDAVKQGRYGFCCPNHPEHLDFVKKQIDEMLAFTEFDAFFFDMPFWPHTCYCEHCRTLYKQRTGNSIPEAYRQADPGYMELARFKFETMGTFIHEVTAHVKHRNPDMVVTHNFACSVAGDSFNSCGEEVLAECDYVGGDLYGSLYNHSFACKYFRSVSRTQPFEQMFSRCKPRLQMHTLTKTRDEMLTALGNTMAHHGATLVIDAVDPIGTMDGRLYDRLKEVFAFQKQYEPWFTGEPVEDIGIYYGIRSRISGDYADSVSCCKNIGQTLIRNHIPFGVTGNFGKLDTYQAIAAPWLSELEKEDNARLIAYVEAGGTLYLSGFGNRELVEALTGHRCLGVTTERNVYAAPTAGWEELFGEFTKEYPLPMETPAVLAEAGAGSRILATLTLPYTKPDEVRFASIHSNPPGIPTGYPAVTVSTFGAGQVIWSALPLEMVEYPEFRQIFRKLLELGIPPVYSFRSDAPANVELTAFRTPEYWTVNLSVLQEEAEAVPVPPFTVEVKTPTPPQAVTRLPDRMQIPFTYRDGYAVFRTETCRIFDMYQIIL